MKISVITACLNCRDTIGEALESVWSQSHHDVESVVVDGGSTDGTVEVLHQYGDRLAVMISEPDTGIYDALNKGLRRATGEVVGFLHADDLFADREVLSRIAAAFEEPETEAIYGDLDYVRKSEPDRVVRHWKAGEFSPSKLRWGWMPPHPTFYVRRLVYERLGAFDTSYGIAADYDCILRFLFKGGVVPVYISKVLVKMRVGGASNRSLSSILQKSREDYRALTSNEVGGAGALAWKNISKVSQFFHAS